MVQCFAADCNHQSERETCKFFSFPKRPAKEQEWRKWVSASRRADREPSVHAKLCSCHFKDGKRESCPTIFSWNKDKLFNFPDPIKTQRKKRTVEKDPEMDEVSNCQALPVADQASTPHTFVTEQLLRVKVIETEMEVAALEKQISDLQLKLQRATSRFTYDSIKGKDDLVSHFTGLPSATTFNALLGLCNHFEIVYHNKWKVDVLLAEDQLLMTLMKLRCNFTRMDLANRFAVSEGTVTNITMTWINVLHSVLFEGLLLVPGIPTVAKNQTSLPSCFSTFSSCRIVLDCTEIQCAIPTGMDKQSLTFSHYKQRNTFKALVGVAFVITFVSKLYPGCTSDKEVVRHSEVLNQTMPGDLVLADKGFLIQDLMPQGVSLNLPPFLTQGQFTPAQITMTMRIARARIHVERAIQRIKQFTILQYVPHNYRGIATKIFQVCGCLVNLQNPLLKEVSQ